jgi:hypothetical protein
MANDRPHAIAPNNRISASNSAPAAAGGGAGDGAQMSPSSEAVMVSVSAVRSTPSNDLAEQLAALRAEVADLRRAQQDKPAPPRSEALERQNTTTNGTNQGDPMPADVDVDSSDLGNLYSYCVHSVLETGTTIGEKTRALALIYASQGVQLLLAFGAFDTGLLLGVLNSFPAFSPPISFSLLYSRHIFCREDDGEMDCMPRINIVCAMVAIILVATWMKDHAEGTVLTLSPFQDFFDEMVAVSYEVAGRSLQLAEGVPVSRIKVTRFRSLFNSLAAFGLLQVESAAPPKRALLAGPRANR